MQPQIRITNVYRIIFTMDQKKRAVVSYENMSEELAAAFAEKYPRGLVDYLPDVKQVKKPDGISIYTVEVEIPSAIYLVKVQIKVDDTEELNKWLDEEASEDDADTQTPNEGDTLPDDNISQYSNGDDDNAD